MTLVLTDNRDIIHEAEAVWQIGRLDQSAAPDLVLLWADGDPKFDNVWDDRASPTTDYS